MVGTILTRSLMNDWKRMSSMQIRSHDSKFESLALTHLRACCSSVRLSPSVALTEGMLHHCTNHILPTLDICGPEAEILSEGNFERNSFVS